jgi:hypothetical protein
MENTLFYGDNLPILRELVPGQEMAAMGVFITLEPPTANTQAAAVKAGKYHSPGWNKDYRRLQIGTLTSFSRAPRSTCRRAPRPSSWRPRPAPPRRSRPSWRSEAGIR